jgi:hypothetical protein
MGNFYTDVIRKDARFGSLQPIHDLALLEPVTRSKVLAIIADAAAAGIKLMAYETFRRQARQTKLYHQRATKLKTVGVHHYGLACDLIKDIAGEPSWKGDFAFLGRLAKKHRMIWGGDWGSPGARHKFVDSVHVQRCAIPRQKALFAGIWYPGEDYDPYA